MASRIAPARPLALFVAAGVVATLAGPMSAQTDPTKPIVAVQPTTGADRKPFFAIVVREKAKYWTVKGKFHEKGNAKAPKANRITTYTKKPYHVIVFDGLDHAHGNKYDLTLESHYIDSSNAHAHDKKDFKLDFGINVRMAERKPKPQFVPFIDITVPIADDTVTPTFTAYGTAGESETISGVMKLDGFEDKSGTTLQNGPKWVILFERLDQSKGYTLEVTSDTDKQPVHPLTVGPAPP